MTTSSRSCRATQADLARRQLQAIESWHRARRAAEQAFEARTASREVRMDLSRHVEVLRTQHDAIVRRTDQHLRDGVHPLTRQVADRAVVVHRNEWFTGKVTAELQRCGIEVVEALCNGAEAVGVVVAEQPELLLVEDSLPMLPGEDVVRETRRFAPDTLVVGLVDYQDRVAALHAVGATAVFTRRVPPAEVVGGAVDLLTRESALV
jgi:predicted site-specific integrase-resolvase